MIGKVIAGGSFSGTVGYVMKQDATILAAEGVAPPEVRDMVRDFKDQTLLNPRLKNTVGHISLSFSVQDKDKLTDKEMTEIARDYMNLMGIKETQFLIVRHHDREHPHCHIVYNRVGNQGQTISDSNMRIRNGQVCKELTAKHGLYYAKGKEQVNEHRLREPDKTKYAIYNAIGNALPGCKSWGDLGKQLQEQGIATRFKHKGQTDTKEGVLFSANGYTFSGSKIDRAYSFGRLNGYFYRVQRQQVTARIPIDGQNKPVSQPSAISPANPISLRNAPLYSPRSVRNLNAATGSYKSAFAGLFGGKGGCSAPEIDLSPFGGRSLPIPPMDAGIGISAAQFQRQPDETPEQHIARITALINAAAEAMATAALEHKRRQQQEINKKKSRGIKM